MDWRTRREEDERALRTLFERDRDWSAYLLGDLEPPYRQHARFQVASRAGRDEAALLIYAPPEFRAMVSFGPEYGVAALLADADLPAIASLSIPAEHQAVFETYYGQATWRTMRRMALSESDFRAPGGLTPVTPLSVADLSAARALLDLSPVTHFFTEAMVAEGVYFGAWVDGALVAVAGTHIVAPASRLAAIGNVFTHPAARGRGLATAATAAVARTLFERGCERLVLNVEATNAATRVYERLGFHTTRLYVETDAAHRRG